MQIDTDSVQTNSESMQTNSDSAWIYMDSKWFTQIHVEHLRECKVLHFRCFVWVSGLSIIIEEPEKIKDQVVPELDTSLLSVVSEGHDGIDLTSILKNRYD
jgi:hypothetical protein